MSAERPARTQAEGRPLLQAVAEIEAWFPDGIALIVGGLAVYAHAAGEAASLTMAGNFVIPFMISVPDFAELQDTQMSVGL